MHPRFFVALLAAPAFAQAVPMHLSHSGRLADASGAALVGDHALHLTIYNGAEAAVWSDTFPVSFTDGYFTVLLGSGAPLTASVFSEDTLTLGLAVNTDPELPLRLPLSSVPFAVRAQDATNVVGGTVDVSEVRINGATVIDSSGAFVGDGGADADTLGALGCTAGQVASYDGLAWACADTGGPHTHDAADITSGTMNIGRLPVGTGSGELAAGDHTHALSSLTGPLQSAQLPTNFTELARGAVTAAPLDLPPGSTLGGAALTTGPAYTDAMAVNAMGAKANTNPLHHDRFTDANAVSAMGAKANTNPLHHDRYTDANAVSAINAATTLDFPATTQVNGANLQQQLRNATARAVCYGGVGAGMAGRTEFSIIMVPYRTGATDLTNLCRTSINNGWNACGVAKSNYWHQDCSNLLNVAYGGGYTSFARTSYAEGRIAAGVYASCTNENMMVCCSPECSGW